ncbi:hypothetical protein RUM43_005048 [Polyplax serrata]|uniref:G-patch domain-containing protein n=1 Tax=Polyplax serrata TaxID=468196 RepID=A0AAN8XM39_POLSC
MKIFVKEKLADSKQDSSVSDRNKFYTAFPLTSEQAKKFYEDVLSEPSQSEEAGANNFLVKTKMTLKQRTVSKRRGTKKIFQNKDLLYMGQNNDVKNLELIFSQNQEFDINIVDDFDWTPLMCASCSGAEEAVKIFLQKGADPTKGDKFGNTPLKLAKQKNFRNIVQLLEDAINKKEIDKKEIMLPSNEPFYCDLCKNNFTEVKNTHESSTLHLFNCKHKSNIFYGIPESNKGFQLLLKEGWNKGEGLGPEGSGRKFPIKAFPKKSRNGIGATGVDQKSRLPLHINNNKTKKGKFHNIGQEKEFEKKFRLEFS